MNQAITRRIIRRPIAEINPLTKNGSVENAAALAPTRCARIHSIGRHVFPMVGFERDSPNSAIRGQTRTRSSLRGGSLASPRGRHDPASGKAGHESNHAETNPVTKYQAVLRYNL